jgi:galactitol-specific phosphotransferase system IIB component
MKKNINKELAKAKNIRTNIMVIKIDRKNSMRLKLDIFIILKMILNKINSNKKNRNPV